MSKRRKSPDDEEEAIEYVGKDFPRAGCSSDQGT